MAAVAPAHYIRTIHTSFTAAHPRNAHAAPAAWAVRSAHPVPKDREAHVPHASYQHHQQQQNQHQAYPPQPVSISTHNAHYYTHHLQALAPPPQGPASASVPMRRRPGSPSTAGAAAGPGPAGAGGRRRSVSIRMPPSYAPSTRGRTAAAQAYKFDPFADDEAPLAPLSVTSPLTGGFAANRGAPHERTEALYGSAGAPYTIHIPAAQPTEIQQYTPPPTPSATQRSARLRSLIPINGPLPGTAPTTLARTTTLASTHPSPSARTTLTRSPSPPTTTGSATPTTRMGAPQPPPNLSKIVAGILLNRVHAVGKPMRRRVLPAVGAGAAAGGYRKSCLSSVISLEL